MVWTLSAIVPSENKDINNWHFYYFYDRASLKKKTKKKTKENKTRRNKSLFAKYNWKCIFLKTFAH